MDSQGSVHGVAHTHVHEDEIAAMGVEEFHRIMELIPSPQPGEDCFACKRPVPKVRSDSLAGPTRQTLSLSIPKGEEGVLEQMLIDLVDKFKDAWPREHASMRQDVGLEVVGGKCWKYHAIHFAVYACMMVPGLAPVEEGQ